MGITGVTYAYAYVWVKCQVEDSTVTEVLSRHQLQGTTIKAAWCTTKAMEAEGDGIPQELVIKQEAQKLLHHTSWQSSELHGQVSPSAEQKGPLGDVPQDLPDPEGQRAEEGASQAQQITITTKRTSSQEEQKVEETVSSKMQPDSRCIFMG